MLARKRLGQVIGAAAMAMVLTVTGCSGGPPSGDERRGGGGSESSAEAYLKDLEGLSPSEREAKLIEDAKKEGELNYYGTRGNGQAYVTAFEEKYGIKVNYHAASLFDLLSRFTQEYNAGRPTADILVNLPATMVRLEQDGLLAPYENERKSEIREGGFGDRWVAKNFAPFVVGYNTDLVSPDELPDDISGFADPKWKGRLAIESGDYDWYAALHQYYQSKGMSEAEIDEMFLAIAKNSQTVQGHSKTMGLLAAGTFDVFLSPYVSQVAQPQSEGAPVGWDLPEYGTVDPVVGFFFAVGVPSNAPHPAAAYLFMDFVLSEAGFEATRSVGAYPPIPSADEPFDDVEMIAIDPVWLAENDQEWSDRYDRLLREAAN